MLQINYKQLKFCNLSNNNAVYEYKRAMWKYEYYKVGDVLTKGARIFRGK